MKWSKVVGLGLLLACVPAVSQTQPSKDPDSVAGLRNALTRMNGLLQEQAKQIQELQGRLKIQGDVLTSIEKKLSGHDRDVLSLRSEITVAKSSASQEATSIRNSMPNAVELRKYIESFGGPNKTPPDSFGCSPDRVMTHVERGDNSDYRAHCVTLTLVHR